MSEVIITLGFALVGFGVLSALATASRRSEQWLAAEDDDGIRGAWWRQSASSAPPSFDGGAFMGSAHGGAEVHFDSVGSRTYVTQQGVVLEAEIVGPNLLRIVGPITSPKGTQPTPSNPSASHA
jgi:hypothetical protein